jgi:phytoene dehydrogenase-like protein
MHFARVAGENLVSPDEKATGVGTFVFVGFLEGYGFGIPVGGSGKLTDALISSIRSNDGDVIGEVDVAAIRVKNGRAVGVTAKDGREFAAKDAVVAALHPHDLGEMVEGLAPEIVKSAAATQVSDIACITVHAALRAPLKFRAGAHVKAVMIELLPNKYDTIRKSFDNLRYGEFSPYPLVGLGSLTMFDPSRAPEGKATMHAWDYVPYQRADGRGWDDTKHHYVKRMLNHMENFLDNVADNVLAYHSDSPVDMERTSSSFRRGDLHGIAYLTYQSGAHRPTPDLGYNVVPGCERLYLVGPFQHPGGGVFGAGRAAAMRASEDLKIDFGKIASGKAR